MDTDLSPNADPCSSVRSVQSVALPQFSRGEYVCLLDTHRPVGALTDDWLALDSTLAARLSVWLDLGRFR